MVGCLVEKFPNKLKKPDLATLQSLPNNLWLVAWSIKQNQQNRNLLNYKTEGKSFVLFKLFLLRYLASLLNVWEFVWETFSKFRKCFYRVWLLNLDSFFKSNFQFEVNFCLMNEQTKNKYFLLSHLPKELIWNGKLPELW